MSSRGVKYSINAMKMGVTSSFVTGCRNSIDMINKIIAAPHGKFAKLMNVWDLDAPWATVAIAGIGAMIVPILAYPYLVDIITDDPRRTAEEERVRMCLQKGIDPYPYLTHRNSAYGAVLPLYVTSEDQVPADIDEFSRMVKRFRKKKLEDFRDWQKKEQEAKEVEKTKWSWRERVLWYRFESGKKKKDLQLDAPSDVPQ